MLTVRDDQVEVFEDHLFEAMRHRIERAIATTFPELSDKVTAGGLVGGGTAEAPQLRAIVERGIENAVDYDIVEGPDFAAFIALGLIVRLVRPGLSAEWINAYVTRPDTPGHLKLRMIEARLRSLAQDDPTFALIDQRVVQARQRAAA